MKNYDNNHNITNVTFLKNPMSVQEINLIIASHKIAGKDVRCMIKDE